MRFIAAGSCVDPFEILQELAEFARMYGLETELPDQPHPCLAILGPDGKRCVICERGPDDLPWFYAMSGRLLAPVSELPGFAKWIASDLSAPRMP
jgi:hypothetical protein